METIRVNISPYSLGVHCVFYKVTRKGVKVGIKVWAKLDTAKTSHRRQLLAYQNGIGPNVFSDLSKIEHRGEIGYGYITELAKHKEFVILSDERALLNKAREVFGCRYEDYHESNVGYIKDKLVIIDFDDYAISHERY